MDDVRIFSSFDLEHDQDLHDLLEEQASLRHSGFEIAARSEIWTTKDSWDESVRQRMSGVDEVVVICGEHSAGSPSMSAELRIARENQKPYFLLWGRREIMCSRPAGVGHADPMYSWTRQILREQIAATLKSVRPSHPRNQS
jgi:hypothetical protein